MASLIPISDANPTRRFPFVTIALVVVNVLSFLRQPLAEGGAALDRFFFQNAPVPCQLVDRCPPDFPVEIPSRGLSSFLVAILVSTFLHANLLHIAGNMLFLWIFGNNVEDRLRPFAYILFYVAGGVVATLAHVATQPDSLTPLVGASGAIASVMGAYLVWFPHARILSIVPILFIFTVLRLPAALVLGLWFVLQFLTNPNSGVAWAAHVGGFVFGAAFAWLVRPRRPRPQPSPPPGW